MKRPIYAIKDAKVGFMAPVVDMNDATAIRSFSMAINNEGSMNYSPNDFDLYKIGEFDEDSGRIFSYDVVEFLVSGSSVYGEKAK